VSGSWSAGSRWQREARIGKEGITGGAERAEEAPQEHLQGNHLLEKAVHICMFLSELQLGRLTS